MKSITSIVNKLITVKETADPDMEIRHLNKFDKMFYAIAEDIIHAGIAEDIKSNNFHTFNSNIYISFMTSRCQVSGYDVAERLKEILEKYEFEYRREFNVTSTRIDDMIFSNEHYSLEIEVNLIEASRQLMVRLYVIQSDKDL